jgi:FdhD protein
MARSGSKSPTDLWSVSGARAQKRSDQVATEEPMEIRLLAGSQRRTVAVTMRTPGHDFELASGFLYAEGVVASRDQVHRLTYCTDPQVDAYQHYNIVQVGLRAHELPDLPILERHFYTTSACGVCGKASLEALHVRGCPKLLPGPQVTPELLAGLAAKFAAAQGVFRTTGGLHAAALFDSDGALVILREDIGRHNALDKVIGWAFLEGRLPLADHLVMVSGRASFELVQKSLVAGVPVLCAVSAPSSLAIDLAREFDMTLVGFLRGDRFNIYAGPERVRLSSPASER